MNNKEIAGRDAPMSLAEQFKWMCKKGTPHAAYDCHAADAK